LRVGKRVIIARLTGDDQTAAYLRKNCFFRLSEQVVHSQYGN
jgi:hypothetical protein